MRFGLTSEQRDFADALDGLLTTADAVAANRSWAAGDHAPGLELWQRLAELGVTALTVPEEHGGFGSTPTDLVVAFERLGYHGAPGPLVESVALAPTLLAGTAPALLSGLAEGSVRATFAVPPVTPYALDADIATDVFLLDGETLSRAMLIEERGTSVSKPTPLQSVDPSRHLFEVTAAESVGSVDEAARERALDLATLACAAGLLGAGERMLDETVTYLGQRRQFGRVIGEYQSLKHAAADVRVALDFTRPLLLGAAGELALGAPESGRAVSAAKVAATDAAALAARTGLQLHGAIGYTLECDLSVWFLRSQALTGCWGTQAAHRARVLESLTRSR